MDMSRIEAFVDLLSRKNVSEITVIDAGGRITVRRSASAPQPPGQLVLHTDSAIVVSEDISESEAPPAEAVAPSTTTIIAPMVGIYHHGEPPVTLGSSVSAGQIVGAIESMKLMNDVRAEVGGVVTGVEVEAGMAVEYGQPLFSLMPNGEGGAI
jgi:acetyl-CoA carboxylase biotin carboxyl carrier protein